MINEMTNVADGFPEGKAIKGYQPYPVYKSNGYPTDRETKRLRFAIHESE